MRVPQVGQRRRSSAAVGLQKGGPAEVAAAEVSGAQDANHSQQAASQRAEWEYLKRDLAAWESTLRSATVGLSEADYVRSKTTCAAQVAFKPTGWILWTSEPGNDGLVRLHGRRLTSRDR